MSIPSSPGSYENCYAMMDAALADPKGARVRLPDRASAYYLRLRCHQARKLDRQKNKETYEKTDIAYGISFYDKLTLRVEEADGAWWMVMAQNSVLPGAVYSLSTNEQLDLGMAIEPPKRPALPAPDPAPSPDDLGEAFDAVETVAEPEPRPLIGDILPPRMRR